MCGTLQRMSIMLFVAILGAAPAGAQQSDWQAGQDWCERAGAGNQEKQVDKSVLIIDHLESRVICPIARPLKVKDGESIRVIFHRTAPDSFSYLISAIEAPTPRTAGAKPGEKAIPVEQLKFTTLPLRHDRHFSQYKIEITPRADLVRVETAGQAAAVDAAAPARAEMLEAALEGQGLFAGADAALEARVLSNRPFATLPEVEGYLASRKPGAKPEEIKAAAREAKEVLEKVDPRPILRPFEATIEVETAGPELTFTSGFSFSDLTSPKFFLASNDAGTPAKAEDDFKTVEVDPNKAEEVEPDVMALINIRWPELMNRSRFWNKVGVAFGLGLNGDSEPRYFLGPSFTLPKGFVFTAGLSGGKVKALPVGQDLGQVPINGDNTLGSLGSRFKVGYHFGISFAFTDRETEVRSHLSGLQATQSEDDDDDGGGDNP